MDTHKEEQNNSRFPGDSPAMETARNAHADETAQNNGKTIGGDTVNEIDAHVAPGTRFPLYLGIFFLCVAVLLGLPMAWIDNGGMRHPTFQQKIAMGLYELMMNLFDLPGDEKFSVRLCGWLTVVVCAPVGVALMTFSALLSARYHGKSIQKAANWFVGIGVCGLILGGGAALGVFSNFNSYRYARDYAGEAARLIAGWGMGIGAVILLVGWLCLVAQRRPKTLDWGGGRTAETLPGRVGDGGVKHFCPTCGAKLAEGQAFCSSCGAKL